MAVASTFMQQLRDNPATKELLESATKFAGAQAAAVAPKVANKLAGGGTSGDVAGDAVEGITDATEKGKGGIGKVLGGLGGAVKGLFKGGKGKGSSNKRPTNIVENVLIGAPVDVVFAKWTAFQEMAGYMKAVEVVDTPKDKDEDKSKDAKDKAKDGKDKAKDGKDDDKNDGGSSEQQETSWKVKVWWSRRSWKATTVEEVENERIKWKTEATKGTVDGVITFAPLGENLTLMLVVIEYRSKGFMEWTANRWRAAGRRVRLDLKHFRRYVMMGELPPPEEHDEHEEDPGEQPEETNQQDQPSEDQPGEDQPEKSGPRVPRAPRAPEKVGAAKNG